jgi:hypothetical protein
MVRDADHFDLLLGSTPALKHGKAATHFFKPDYVFPRDNGSNFHVLVIHHDQRPIAILQYWNSEIFTVQISLYYELEVNT